MKPTLSKQSLRTHCRQLRAALPADSRIAHAQAFARLFYSHIKPHGKTIAGYAPLPDELDVMPLLVELEASGHSCCLPATQPGTPILRFYQWHPETRMVRGDFGTSMPDPTTSKATTPDIIIVPLVGFDADCHRIGYGAGYYDATLHALRSGGKKILAVGAAFSCQQVDAIPIETHDEALDMILTEKGVVQKP